MKAFLLFALAGCAVIGSASAKSVFAPWQFSREDGICAVTTDDDDRYVIFKENRNEAGAVMGLGIILAKRRLPAWDYQESTPTLVRLWMLHQDPLRVHGTTIGDHFESNLPVEVILPFLRSAAAAFRIQFLDEPEWDMVGLGPDMVRSMIDCIGEHMPIR